VISQTDSKESLKRVRLGQDVLVYAAVRSAALQIDQESATASMSTGATQVANALNQVSVLKDELTRTQAEARAIQELFELSEQELERAREEQEKAHAEATKLHYALDRIKQLEGQLAARGLRPDTSVALPTAWGELLEWCDDELRGRVVIAPAARKGIKKADFQDAALAARCLRWLSGECRERRLNGGGAIANISIEEGIENAPCGADNFSFSFQGRRLTADWHIKNGGNTREPRRCLRIYYAWDDSTQQIVIAEMPAHRRTGAS